MYAFIKYMIYSICICMYAFIKYGSSRLAATVHTTGTETGSVDIFTERSALFYIILTLVSKPPTNYTYLELHQGNTSKNSNNKINNTYLGLHQDNTSKNSNNRIRLDTENIAHKRPVLLVLCYRLDKFAPDSKLDSMYK